MPDAHDHVLAALRATGAWAATADSASGASASAHRDRAHADATTVALGALGDETLAWAVRAALRSTHAERWRTIDRAIGAMRPATRDEPAWRYWAARASLALAMRTNVEGSARDPGESAPVEGTAMVRMRDDTVTAARSALAAPAHRAADADDRSRQAHAALAALAGELHFYGLLAAENLGRRFTLPQRPAATTAAERDAARGHPGLASALALIAAGLRDEGNREWNYSLRGMDDRELIAAAQWACEREVWDRCINTSDRSRSLVDVAQRYPTPWRQPLEAAARAAGLEPAFAYGIIRQESRFITTVRSHAGASGLMQLMPATARWTAKRIGLPLSKSSVLDPDVNMRLGTHYLKLVLDDFEGSHAMAAAAYNAGPSRPRRWREGSPVESAAWAETIPFDETRDYVKKVLTNTVVYAAVLGGDATRTSLAARLGPAIGPRDVTARAADLELP
jgi:soluble lytic murein transglycosylase